MHFFIPFSFLLVINRSEGFDPVNYDEDSEIEPKSHPYGAPIDVMSISDSGQFVDDYELFDKTFLHPDVANRKIVVISIVGALRKGKSFFLNYCLRFLYANVSETGMLST